MNSIELDKYVRETLLAPLEQEEETLPPDKQLALCLMAGSLPPVPRGLAGSL